MQRLWRILPLLWLWACQSEATDTTATPDKEDPLFIKLDPSTTGVNFTNRIQENNQINILSYEYLYNGSGVAVGDINNDGYPDLYFAATNGSNRLYLNKGDGSFADITTASGTGVTEGFKTGVTMADINGDGWLDIYVCRTGKFRSENRANLLFINQKDGTFQEAGAIYGLNDPSFSNQAIFFDYDKDGDLDCYLVNHPVDFKNANNVALKYDGPDLVKSWPEDLTFFTDRLYRNEGNRFVNVSPAAGIQNYAYGLSATLLDVNQDGWLDIYVANDYIEPDYLYVNNGDGTFTESLADYVRKVSHNSMGSDVADYNNDGQEDIIVLDMLPEDNYRQKLLANVMKYDRYTTQLKYGFYHQQMRNMLQLNNGNGSFSEVGQLAGVSHTDWSWGPLLADFDLDGWKDLYIANGYRRDITNLDYMNYTLDSLNKAGGVAALNDIYDLLDRVPETPIENYMYRNARDLTFEKVTTAWGLDQTSFSNGASFADLDADGDLDLIVNNVNEPAFLYLNQAVERGGHFLTVKLDGTGKNTDAVGALATLVTEEGKQVQRLVPARGYMSSVEPILHFGMGGATEGDLTIVWPDGQVSRETVQANQHLTLQQSKATEKTGGATPSSEGFWQAAANTGIDFTHQENDDFIDFKREPLLPHEFSHWGPAMAKSDINGDGREDIWIGGAKDQAGAVYLQQVDGRFLATTQPALQADVNHEDADGTWLDANGDGTLDLYVASGGSEWPAQSAAYQDRLYMNDGQGRLTKATSALPELTASAGTVVALDGDQDGDTDLFVGNRVTPGAYPQTPQSYWLNNEGGTFTLANDRLPDEGYVGMVNDALAADLDRDGQSELLVVGEWMAVEQWAVTDEGWQRQEEAFAGPNQGWWFSVHTTDVDGDGDLDVLTGNLGLNSQFKASAEAPSEVWYADFDGNGVMDPILTTQYADGVFPVPTRDQLVDQIPAFRSRVFYYDNYARMPIEALLTEEERASAQRKIATTFASCWWENDGTGSFTRHVLPNRFQLAPILTWEVLPTEEGAPWLLAAGNWRCADVMSGTYDAGNGIMARWSAQQKDWHILSIAEQGFFIPGEVRNMLRLSTAKGDHLIVGQNDEPVAVFSHTITTVTP